MQRQFPDVVTPRRGPPGRCAAVTPRIDPRRFGPCQAFLSNASSSRSSSRRISESSLRTSAIESPMSRRLLHRPTAACIACLRFLCVTILRYTHMVLIGSVRRPQQTRVVRHACEMFSGRSVNNGPLTSETPGRANAEPPWTRPRRDTTVAPQTGLGAARISA